MIPLKYLSNFSRTLEISLINCKTNLILTWYANCILSSAAAGQVAKFATTNAKLYVVTFIMLNYFNKENQRLEVQLTGRNIIQKQNH